MPRHYVINLSHATQRRAHIIKEFQDRDVPFEFFDAVTPDSNQRVAASLGLNIDDTLCSAGEIACLLSHVSLWHRAIDDGIDYIGIFEDDICLSTASKPYLQNDTLLAQHNIELLKLDKVGKWVRLKNKIDLIDSDRHIFEMSSRLVGGAGYILSNHGAQLLIEKLKTLSSLEAVDVFLFDVEKYTKDFATYYLHPSIVIQRHKLMNNGDDLDSSLKTQRGRETKPSRTIRQRVTKEIMRNLRPLIMTKTTFK